MEAQQLTQLFKRYLDNQCSAAEIELLLILFHTPNEDVLGDLVAQALNQNIQLSVTQEQQLQFSVDRVHQNLKQHMFTSGQVKDEPVMKRMWPRIAGVAAAVAAIAFGIWLYTYEFASSGKTDHIGEVATNDIVPGKNMATLTLSNGRTISLSDAKTGVVIDISGSGLRYNDGTEIASNSERSLGDETAKRPQFVTASTPRGGTYQVMLSDGTKVWLNADSRLKFPSKFNNERRIVELQGEAYFEVYKDKKHPFVVVSDDQEVEVLGTHFNVNAYKDEHLTKTTLLEGKVRVGRRNEKKILIQEKTIKPGEQTVLEQNTLIVRSNVDTQAEVAWKNGQFVFVNEPIEEIMRKISRWYDVEVIYQGDMTNKAFAGTVSRFDNLSKLLNMIESTNTVHFKIKGRSVIVMD